VCLRLEWDGMAFAAVNAILEETFTKYPQFAAAQGK
jgi:hypothetical protein